MHELRRGERLLVIHRSAKFRKVGRRAGWLTPCSPAILRRHNLTNSRAVERSEALLFFEIEHALLGVDIHAEVAQKIQS